MYRILIKIYYGLFRLKKNELARKALREIMRNQLVYFFILALTIGFIVSNLSNPIHPNLQTNNLAKTILAHLIPSDFSTGPSEVLITETAISSNALLAEQSKHAYSLDLLNKRLAPISGERLEQNNLPIFNNNRDLIFKPLIVNNSTYHAERQQTVRSQRNSIINYTIKSGDTISAIARYFGISVNTILWANHLTAYTLIKPGYKLIILPTSGVLYTAQSGDTISGLAHEYRVSTKAILAANNLSAGLKIGQKIIIPGGKHINRYVATTRPARTRINNSYTGISAIRNLIQAPSGQVSRSGLIWPTVGHVITQYYSWHHHGIDIANKIGTPIYAAASGRVVIARGGWNGGYGNTILLDNGNGISTRYGHTSKLLVRPGQYVKRGQIIALMGSSGNSTGPHLHFEVLINGIRRNPLNYVR